MRQYSIVSLAIIWCSIICAALLQIIPVPPLLEAFRPNWILLVALYWSLALPHRFNLGSAWVSGFVLDLLWGTTLGINALAFVCTLTIAVAQHRKIRSFSIWQQALLAVLFSFLYQVLSYFIESGLNGARIPQHYYYSSLVALVVWPWLFLVLRKTRRHWRIT